MKNILFVMPFLGRTGAERVIFNLANNINKTKYTAHILLYTDDTERNSLLCDLSDDISVNFLNVKGRARYNLHKIIFGIRDYCKKNNIHTLLISDGTANAFISPLLFLLGKNVRKIARESNLPSLYEKNTIAKLLYKYCYNNYDLIVVQSDDMYTDMMSKMGISESKLVKINNPLDLNRIKKMSSMVPDFLFPNDKINLLTIGRLTYQKGFDILLNTFSKINTDIFHLTIIGTGEEKNNLLLQARNLGINDKVTFVPNTDNPYALMKNADIFVSSSRWEGYPNVVIESLACGTPVLANNYPGGINEIINSDNGFICNLEKELATGLDYVRKLPPIIFDKNKIMEIYKKYELIF